MSEQPTNSPVPQSPAPEPEGTVLSPDELVARAVISSRLYNKQTLALKPEAFEPPPDGNLSVTRHKGVEIAFIWERCQDVIINQTNRKLYGRADLSAKSVSDSRSGMAAVAAWRTHNPAHAHIVGWPREVPAKMEVQLALAAAAQFVAAPHAATTRKALDS